jgi:hypothetical protein
LPCSTLVHGKVFTGYHPIAEFASKVSPLYLFRWAEGPKNIISFQIFMSILKGDHVLGCNGAEEFQQKNIV